MIHKLAEKLGMESNGYSYFHEENYKLKNDKPCFIPENGEDESDVQSWKDLFTEAHETILTKEFLLAVMENYDHDTSTLENIDEDSIDYEDVYLEITNETPDKFAETFMDNYFLGGDEVWCSLSTKLQDYMM